MYVTVRTTPPRALRSAPLLNLAWEFMGHFSSGASLRPAAIDRIGGAGDPTRF